MQDFTEYLADLMADAPPAGEIIYSFESKITYCPAPVRPAPAPVATFEYMRAVAETMNAGGIVHNLSLTAVGNMQPDVMAYFFGLIGHGEPAWHPPMSPMPIDNSIQTHTTIWDEAPVILVAPVQAYDWH